MSAFLADWWPLLCLTAWVAIVAAFLIANHRWCVQHRADITRRAAYPPPVVPEVNWLPFLPPVPTQRQIDETWLDVWPTELQQEQYDRLFDELIAIEGLQ